jgi:hypothetical protein
MAGKSLEGKARDGVFGSRRSLLSLLSRDVPDRLFFSSI